MLLLRRLRAETFWSGDVSLRAQPAAPVSPRSLAIRPPFPPWGFSLDRHRLTSFPSGNSRGAFPSIPGEGFAVFGSVEHALN